MKVSCVLLIGLLLAGCASPETRRREIEASWAPKPRIHQTQEQQEALCQQARKMYVQEHPELAPAVRDAILAGRVEVGMGQREVVAAWTLWHHLTDAEAKRYQAMKVPTVHGLLDTHRITTAFGVHEQWVLSNTMVSNTYLEFDNYVLTAIQN